MSPDPTPPPSEPAPSLRPVEELQALCDAATPEPWFASSREGDEESWWIWSTEQDDGTPFPVALMSYEGPDVDSDGEREEADAQFIAAARTALPALLARLRAAEETLVGAIEWVETFDCECFGGNEYQDAERCDRCTFLRMFRAALAEGASR